MMWSNWNAMGFFGWTMMILFWVAVVVLFVWAIRSATTTRDGSGTLSALGILERRYAAGEIGRDEFEEGQQVLGATRRSDS